MTRDEAHAAVARSSCRVALEVDANRMALRRLLTRRGSLARLSPPDRHLVADHWALIDLLKEHGYDDIVDAELEGVLSVVKDGSISMSILADVAWAADEPSDFGRVEEEAAA